MNSKQLGKFSVFFLKGLFGAWRWVKACQTWPGLTPVFVALFSAGRFYDSAELLGVRDDWLLRFCLWKLGFTLMVVGALCGGDIHSLAIGLLTSRVYFCVLIYRARTASSFEA